MRSAASLFQEIVERELPGSIIFLARRAEQDRFTTETRLSYSLYYFGTSFIYLYINIYWLLFSVSASLYSAELTGEALPKNDDGVASMYGFELQMSLMLRARFECFIFAPRARANIFHILTARLLSRYLRPPPSFLLNA